MSRAVRVLLILSITLLSGSSAFAQKEPPETKELKEAEKFRASAMMAGDSAERKSRLGRALNPLQQAMVKTPDNARVWLVAGQVYAALGEYARADSAFVKAQQLHPAYADEITNQRLGAWAAAFNAGVELMDQRKYDEAITMMQTAETMYAERPESKMNLAALYANKGDVTRAEAFFRSVLELTNSPAKTKLKPEDAAQWGRFAEMATINLAQMIGQRGVDAFEHERYDEAIRFFRDAHALNAQARDYAYNLAQSLYAKARQQEQARTKLLEEEKTARVKKDLKTANAKAAEAKQLAAELVAAYNEVEPLVTKTRIVDPNNEDVYLLLMRAHRVRGDLSPTGPTKTDYTKRAEELLRQHQALEAEVLGISITPGGGEAIVRGELRNLKLSPGTPVKVRMTLLGLTGSPVGEEEVSVTAPAAQQTAKFEMRTKLNGELAAWKYQIVK